jgi:hypothetical protein
MTSVHRLEIVVDAPHSARVIELLAAHGVRSYTLIRGVAGSGERGPQLGDDLAGVSNNHYLLTTCPPELLEAVTEALRPLLARIGGMCLISDARWLLH